MKKYLSRTKNIILPALLLATFIFLAAVPAVFADGLVPCSTSTNTGACTLCHLATGLENIVNFFKNLLFTATVLFVVAAGVIYMVSGGSKSLMDWAKKAISYSLTGFILLLCSWLIIAAVLTALGYNQSSTWYNFECDDTPVNSSSSIKIM